MLILLGLLLLLVVFFIMARHGDSCGWEETIGEIGAGCSGAFFVVALLIMLGVHLSMPAKVVRFESMRATVEAARGRSGETGSLELAAIQMKVVEQNAWLAEGQYWNGTIFDWWVPDSVLDLEPIR